MQYSCVIKFNFLVQKGKNDNRDCVTMHNLRQRNVGAWVSCFFKKVETFLEVIVRWLFKQRQGEEKNCFETKPKHLVIDSYHFNFSSSCFKTLKPRMDSF